MGSSLRWKKILSMPGGCLCNVLRITVVTSFGAGKESSDQLMHLTRSAPCHCKDLGLSPNWGQAFGKTLPPVCSSVRRKIPTLLCNPCAHAHQNSLLWGSFWSTVCMKTYHVLHSTAELCDQGRAAIKQVLDHLVQFLHDVDSLFWFHLPLKITSYFMIFMPADIGLFLL